ncbi:MULTISPECIES: endolytic transglycosylase MltG [Atopobiaceae]|uniref:endolytic transglycosylase MltG n=1 Tax=Atopobiaceae TaxID=1643824 RepID=UPI00034E7829|nr:MULTISPECIES: endolytic transglycosylase MltG [Atopobiaceae]EPD78260.1 UPF0755 protein [Atopobium sp. oral taxon 199 str. F0494]
MSISPDNDTSSTGAARFTEDASSEEVLSGREESPEPSLGKHAAALPASLETNRISKRTAAATRRAVRGNVAHRNKKAHRRSRLFATLIALALIGFAAAIFVFVVVPKITDTVNPTQEITSGEEVTVVIPEGANASTVADILYTNKVIANKAEFLAQLKKQQSDQKIKSGTYLITTGMSYADIIRLLAEGPNTNGDGLVIPEGYTVSQTAEAVEKYYGISKDDFLAQAKASNYVEEYPFLKDAVSANDSLEGYLFPKTYTFESTPSADTIIRAMLDQYKEETSDLNFDAARIDLKARYNLDLTDEQILTVASIVEKEASNQEDRGNVASVIYNRLSQGMPLQSDATLAYSLGREPTADELQTLTDDKYNTYAHDELTPTPICSPGLNALKAALRPNNTDYLYFWITKNEHVFSKTYDEHLEAINNSKDKESSQ